MKNNDYSASTETTIIITKNWLSLSQAQSLISFYPSIALYFIGLTQTSQCSVSVLTLIKFVALYQTFKKRFSVWKNVF